MVPASRRHRTRQLCRRLGDIEPIENGGKVERLITSTARASVGDRQDGQSPGLVDALQVAVEAGRRNRPAPGNSKARCTEFRSPSRISSTPSTCGRPAARRALTPTTVAATRTVVARPGRRARSSSPRRTGRGRGRRPQHLWRHDAPTVRHEPERGAFQRRIGAAVAANLVTRALGEETGRPPQSGVEREPGRDRRDAVAR